VQAADDGPNNDSRPSASPLTDGSPNHNSRPSSSLNNDGRPNHSTPRAAIPYDRGPFPADGPDTGAWLVTYGLTVVADLPVMLARYAATWIVAAIALKLTGDSVAGAATWAKLAALAPGGVVGGGACQPGRQRLVVAATRGRAPMRRSRLWLTLLRGGLGMRILAEHRRGQRCSMTPSPIGA
jgi:hypothetical protein